MILLSPFRVKEAKIGIYKHVCTEAEADKCDAGNAYGNKEEEEKKERRDMENFD